MRARASVSLPGGARQTYTSNPTQSNPTQGRSRWPLDNSPRNRVRDAGRLGWRDGPRYPVVVVVPGRALGNEERMFGHVVD